MRINNKLIDPSTSNFRNSSRNSSLKNSVEFRHKLLASAISALFVSGALAQPAETEGLEEIQITGSRIRNVTSMSTPNPVTALTVDELANLNPGATVAEQLDSLPQFFATTTAQRGGGFLGVSGGSYLDLRGMGRPRTLVLLDGSRIIPADANGSVNIENFPSALLQRVDVVTGGASAAYGADAVAGVVNFVLNHEFEGLKGQVSTGISERMDGDRYNFQLAGGTSIMDGRLHLIGSAEQRFINQIEAAPDALDNWNDWGLVRNPKYNAADPVGTNPLRITVPYVFGNQASPQGLINGPANFSLRNYTFTDDGKGVRPYVFGNNNSSAGAGNQNNQSGGPEYTYSKLSRNAGPDGNESIQRSFLAGFKFDVSDNFSLNGTAILGRSESNYLEQRSNMAIAGPTYQFTLFKENPYLPKTVVDAMTTANITSFTMSKIGMVRGPGMKNVFEHRGDRSVVQLESYTVGFDYQLENSWNISGHYQKGESIIQGAVLNVPRIDRYFLAMDAVPDASGKPMCNVTKVNPTPQQLKDFMVGKRLPSPLTIDGVIGDSPIGPVDFASCVPFNVLGLGNANDAAIDWIEDEQKKLERIIEQDFAEVLVTGDVFKGWAGPVSIAAGATWRDESFTIVNYPSYGERGVLNAPTLGIRGISPGFASAGNRSLHPFSASGVNGGAGNVTELFAELNVPLYDSGQAQKLDSTFAYRNSDYSSSGRVPSWKMGFNATLTDDLRLRYTKSHDVREPNFAERYLTGSGGGSVQDKQLNNVTNSSLTILATPNTRLNVEEANTDTAGFVYQPSFAEWVDGVQIALDWYEITLTGAIARYGAQRIADDCFATKNAYTCGLIARDSNTQTITRILDEYVNVGGAQTRGVDLEVQYTVEPNFFSSQQESLSMRVLAGYLGENSTTSAAGTTVNAVGGTERAQNTANVSMNYSIGDYSVRAVANYYGDTMVNTLWIQGVDIDDNTISSQTTINLGLSYGQEMARGGDWSTSLSISNLFDRDPPIVPGTGGQSLSNSHDQFGRRYQISLDMSF